MDENDIDLFDRYILKYGIKDENIMDILKRFLFVITAIVVIAILFVPLMLIQFPIVLGIGLYHYIVKGIPMMRVFAETVLGQGKGMDCPVMEQVVFYAQIVFWVSLFLLIH